MPEVRNNKKVCFHLNYAYPVICISYVIKSGTLPSLREQSNIIVIFFGLKNLAPSGLFGKDNSLQRIS